MDQLSFSDAEYQRKRRKTRREKFLAEMDQLIPWAKLEKKLKKHYHKGERGRPPYALSIMLRIHCMQVFYNLSDPAMEDALIEIDSMRRFAGLRTSDRYPDETTILNFRRFLEQHNLSDVVLRTINQHLEEKGMLLREGTIVDATIIDAPSSTKNKEGKRDPEMHQTRKGNQWYHGMKCHIGVDVHTGIIHSLEATAANVHDLTPIASLLHGREQYIFGDSGYTGLDKRQDMKDCQARMEIAMKPGKRRQLDKDSSDETIERIKAKIRAKVEHPFRLFKCVFGYTKVRYRGLAKNKARLNVMAGLANLITMKRYLLA